MLCGLWLCPGGFVGESSLRSTVGPSRGTVPASRRSARSGQRIADRRCAAASGGRGPWRGWARARLRGVSGVLPPYGGVTHRVVPTWKAHSRTAYSRSITHLVWYARPRPVRSVRSGQRIADRRCAVACGGEGLRRVLGSLTRLFRVAVHMVVTHGAGPA